MLRGVVLAQMGLALRTPPSTPADAPVIGAPLDLGIHPMRMLRAYVFLP